MYSDLFDALGGGGAGAQNSSSSTSAREEPKPLLSFKAGKVNLALRENGKYWATPDTRRGQVNLKYNDDDQLTWEWYDRREKKVVDTLILDEPAELKQADVPKSQDLDSNDRVYFWKLGSQWKMIWLQDKEEDQELIVKANKILKTPKKPAEGTTEAAASSAGGPVSARSPGDASKGSKQKDRGSGPSQTTRISVKLQETSNLLTVSNTMCIPPEINV